MNGGNISVSGVYLGRVGEYKSYCEYKSTRVQEDKSTRVGEYKSRRVLGVWVV